MKTLVGIDIPEDKEELLYLQLIHDNQYNKHLASSFSMIIHLSHAKSSFVSDKFTKLLEEFVEWLPTQQLIDLKFSCMSGGMYMTLCGDTKIKVTIQREHRRWYYGLAHLAVSSIAIELSNGNL